MKTLAKACTLGIIGVYPPQDQFFPIGAAMNKNLSINLRSCNNRTYIPKLVAKVTSGTTDPTTVLSQQASERKDGFGTEGIGEDGDGSMGIAGSSGGGTGSLGTGDSQRGGRAVEGAFGADDGAKGRRTPSNKQGIAKGDGPQD